MKSLYVLCIGLIVLSCNNKPVLPVPLDAGWHGELVCNLVHEDVEFRVLKCIFPLVVGHEMHEHQPHFGYTLNGIKFTITDQNGNRQVCVKTGDHYSRADGR